MTDATNAVLASRDDGADARAARCQVCATPLEAVLDLGALPLTNRFPRSPSAPEVTHPFVLGMCPPCGLAQLARPVAARDLRRRVDWITYREPEGHLDEVADAVAGLVGLSPKSRIVGLGDHEETLLRRLRDRGFRRT